MKLSTKGRYGVRALLDVALHQHEGPVTLSNIAGREDISEGYLEQLVVPLKGAGLIKSVRGPQGGYLLSRNPGEVTVGEIIRALEGPIAPVACVSEDSPEECRRFASCPTRLVWARVRDCISSVLDSYSLADLVQESKRLAQPEGMYYI